MQIRSFLSSVAVMLFAGCAATVQRPAAEPVMASLPASAAAKLVLNVGGSKTSVNASDWAGFKEEWRENFSEQARLAGVPFAMQEGAPQPTGETGTLLSVYVDDYRFIRPGTRYATGILSGNAYIESKLTFSDLKTGAVWGSKAANTSSSAWQGVFSAMTNKQVEAIAADVMRDLKRSGEGR
jgi:hypothetical protein